MRVLFLGCHCDDIELGCGATIHKHRDDWDITTIVLSQSAIIGRKEYEMADAAKAALQHLGVQPDKIRVLNYRNNYFYLERQSIWELLRNLNEELRPDLVFSQEPDYHQDHETLYNETMRNFRDSSTILYKSSYKNAPNSNFNYAERISHINLAAKQRSLEFYYPGYKELIYFKPENIEARLRVAGILANCDLAEAFQIVKLIK